MDVLYTSFPSTVTITSFPSFCVILIAAKLISEIASTAAIKIISFFFIFIP